MIRLPGEAKLPPIPYLIELTLKVIYDRKNCTDRDISDVPRFIERYHEAIQKAKAILMDKYGADYIFNDPRPLGTKGTELDETEFWIAWCAKRLVENEENIGEVARNKHLIMLHNVDYRKIYRLPGAVTAKDIARAMEYLKEAMKENPQDYENN